jgi:hypothetical protein
LLPLKVSPLVSTLAPGGAVAWPVVATRALEVKIGYCGWRDFELGGAL